MEFFEDITILKKAKDRYKHMKKTTVKQIADKMTSAQNYTVFIVGDSITEGARATDDDRTYTAVFAKGIASHFPTRRVIRYDGVRQQAENAALLPLRDYGEAICIQDGSEGVLTVIRCGIGGNTVKRIYNRKGDFIGNPICEHPDLYIVMAGINDSISANADKYATPEEYGKNLCELYDALRCGAPDADIIFMTPTYNDDGTSRNSSVSPYAEKMREICKEKQIPIIDQHSLWMSHLCIGGDNYGQGEWLCGVEGDFCHPSDIGHAAIANEMLARLFE